MRGLSPGRKSGSGTGSGIGVGSGAGSRSSKTLLRQVRSELPVATLAQSGSGLRSNLATAT